MSDDLTGAMHIFEVVLSTEHNQASMALSVTNGEEAFKSWTKKSSYIMKHPVLGQEHRITHGFTKFLFPSEICNLQPQSPTSPKVTSWEAATNRQGL